MCNVISLEENGLNIVQIGSFINQVSFATPLKNHPNNNFLVTGFNDDFSYYFLNVSNMSLGNIGQVNDVFIAIDKSKEIISIFLTIMSNIEIIGIVNNIFGIPKLNSNSSISGANFNNKTFWKKNDISVFLTTNNFSLQSILTIRNVCVAGNAPDIFFIN